MFFVTSYARHSGVGAVCGKQGAAAANRRRLGADGLAGPAIEAAWFLALLYRKFVL
jgi:hypothetical protein